MKKGLRARLAEIERLGLTVVEIDGSKHHKIRVVAPDGRTTQIVISRSPEDVGRAPRAFRAQLKRFAQRPAVRQ